MEEEARPKGIAWGKALRWVGLAIAGAVLSAVVGWFTPLANPVRNWTLDTLRELTAPMPGQFADDEYGVLIADFAGDDGERTQTRRLYEALEAQFPQDGLIRLERLPRVIRIRSENSGARDQAESRARALLEETNAELLIWGESRADNAELVIRYTARTAAGGEFFRAFTDQTIRSELAGNLAPAIAATLIAGASQSYDGEQFPEPNMGVSIERMDALLAAESDWLSAPLRAELAHVLGVLHFQVGQTAGSRRAYQSSASAFRMSIANASKENQSTVWAGSQDGLGNALSALGQGEASDTTLNAAVAAFREALSVRSPQTSPNYWATTQMNLGITLRILAIRNRQPSQLAESLRAFEQAETTVTETSNPRLWARLQNNFAQSLRSLGEHSGQIEPLREAARRFRETARVSEHTQSQFVWAAAQRNLGVTLTILGQRTRDIETLREAVDAINHAITATGRESAPHLWASTHRSLSNAYLSIAELEQGVESLELAARALDQALLEFTQQRHPGDWAWTQNDMGLVLEVAGDKATGDTARRAYEQAAIRFEMAFRAMEPVAPPSELEIVFANYSRVMGKARSTFP